MWSPVRPAAAPPTPRPLGSSSCKRASHSPLQKAFQSLYSDIVDLEQTVAESPTAAFLNPLKYRRTLTTFSPQKPVKKPSEGVISQRKPVAVYEEKVETVQMFRSLDIGKHSVERIRKKLPPVTGAEGGHLSPLVPREDSPRFPRTFRETIDEYRPSIRELSPEELRDLSRRIQTNISKAKLSTHESRLCAIQLRSQLTDERLLTNRQTRSILSDTKRRKRIAALEDKQRKFYWRQNAASVSHGKFIWSGLLTALSILRPVLQQTLHQKGIHEEARKLLTLLLAVSISTGKIIRLVRKRRLQKALGVVHVISPYVRRWAASLRKRKGIHVTRLVEIVAYQEIIRKLISGWTSQIVTIQRGIRCWLSIRSAQKVALLRHWTRAENSTAVKGLSITPQRIKEVVIANTVRKLAWQHAKRLTEWRDGCRRLRARRNSVLRVDPLSGSQAFTIPMKPKFRLKLSVEEIKSAVEALERQKIRSIRR